MKAISIHGMNIKGSCFTKPLLPITIITGPIGSGKTTIADAMRLALLGYVPSLGKRASDTGTLCGSDEQRVATEMRVTLELSAPGKRSSIERSWSLQRGSWKAESDSNGVGIDFAPPVMLDINAYFGMTGAERLRYVFNQMDLTNHGLSPDHIKASIRGLRPETPTPEAEQAIDQLLLKADEIAEADEEQSVQDWLAKFLDHIRELKSALDAELKRMTNAMQAGTQVAANDAPQRPLNVITAELNKARIDERTALDAIAEITRAEKQLVADRLRIEDAKNALRLTPDKSEQLADVLKSLQTLNEQMANYASETPFLRDTVEGSRMVKASLTQERAGIKNRLDKFMDDASDIINAKCCPTCKSKGKGWKDSYQAWMDDQTKEMQVEVDALNAKLDPIEKAITEHEAKLVKSRAQDALHVIRITTRETLLNKRNEWAAQNAKRKFMLEQLSGFLEPQQVQSAEPWKAKLRSFTESARKLDVERLQAAGAQQDSVRREQFKKQQLTAEAQREVAKLALVAMTETQQKLVDAAYNGIVEKVNAFTYGILPAPLEYRDGEIGYIRDATWVGHKTFSGSEQMVTYAGLCVALCQSSPYKLVILDELGRMAASDKVCVLANMTTLIKRGDVDQFIGLDVNTSDWKGIILATNIEAMHIVCTR